MCVPCGPLFKRCKVSLFSTKSIWLTRFFCIRMWKALVHFSDILRSENFRGCLFFGYSMNWLRYLSNYQQMGKNNQRNYMNRSTFRTIKYMNKSKDQVYEWGKFRNTGSNTRTTITQLLQLPPAPPPPPPHTHTHTHSSSLHRHSLFCAWADIMQQTTYHCPDRALQMCTLVCSLLSGEDLLSLHIQHSEHTQTVFMTQITLLRFRSQNDIRV